MIICLIIYIYFLSGSVIKLILWTYCTSYCLRQDLIIAMHTIIKKLGLKIPTAS